MPDGFDRVSSKSICYSSMGLYRGCYPRDSPDFGRCRLKASVVGKFRQFEICTRHVRKCDVNAYCLITSQVDPYI